MVSVTVKFAGYLLHIVYPVFDTVMVGVAVCREGVWTPPVRAWRHCAWYWGSRTSPRSSQAPSLPTREYSWICFLKPLYYSHAEHLGCLTWVWLQLPQEERYPFLPESAVFLCIPATACRPLFGIFNVQTDADACGCTWGLHEHCYKSPHWKSTGRKITCCISKLIPRWYCTWRFGPTLYQLRYPTHLSVCVATRWRKIRHGDRLNFCEFQQFCFQPSKGEKTCLGKKKNKSVEIRCFSNVFSSGLLAFSNRTFMEMSHSVCRFFFVHFLIFLIL